MSNSELLISQLPMMPDYFNVARSYWAASRHPENIADIVDAAKESSRDFSLKDKSILLGTTAITLFQQLPLNEMAVGIAAGATLEATGSIPYTVAAAGLVTGAAEFSSGLGTAYCLEKLGPAVDVMSNRYIDKEKIQKKDTTTDNSKASELGRIYATASIGLTSGATIYEDLRNRERTLKDRVKTATLAASMVVANYTAVTFVLTGGARGIEEWAGVEGATEKFASTISNPVVMGGALGTIFGAIKWKERRETQKRLKAGNETESRQNEPNRMSRIFKRKHSKMPADTSNAQARQEALGV